MNCILTDSEITISIYIHTNSTIMKIQYLLKTGLIAGVVVAVINVIIYVISKKAGIISDDILLSGGVPLSMVPVVISSVLPGVVASLLLWGISKYSGNPIRVFSVIGWAFLIVSMVGPFSAAGLPMGMRISLALMHLAAGVTIIYLLTRKNVKYRV